MKKGINAQKAERETRKRVGGPNAGGSPATIKEYSFVGSLRTEN